MSVRFSNNSISKGGVIQLRRLLFYQYSFFKQGFRIKSTGTKF